MIYIKKIFKTLFFIGILFLIGIYGSNKLVEKAAADKIYNSTTKIPHNKVGLFLGTAKYVSNGQINLYYKYRIDAAVALFKAGKIKFILVSGDNSTKEYDEPSTIKKDLISKGIPANKIYLDYAGFRTLDSVVRCKEIFGQNSITIISQQFHNERAIYIANCKDIHAIGFNAKDVSVHYGFKTQLREKLARVKMVIDLVIGKEPKFLGDKIEIR
ncbi:SanA/YdcF family protein [Marinifilum flexuosum]|uniref:SanA protein n=1 Tax=Marinifilum flexuosum TaxID=1117708 RepID=A0A419X3X9_9BACT|nr:ElyC/SanA/YdcF family protein [Marinifilum flexuosum]RKE02417.1 SanA protein [Marinifilum flexuosum]